MRTSQTELLCQRSEPRLSTPRRWFLVRGLVGRIYFLILTPQKMIASGCFSELARASKDEIENPLVTLGHQPSDPSRQSQLCHSKPQKGDPWLPIDLWTVHTPAFLASPLTTWESLLHLSHSTHHSTTRGRLQTDLQFRLFHSFPNMAPQSPNGRRETYNEESPLFGSFDSTSSNIIQTEYCTTNEGFGNNGLDCGRVVRHEKNPFQQDSCFYDSIRPDCLAGFETPKDDMYESFRSFLVGDSFIEAEKKLYRKIRWMLATAGLSLVAILALATYAIKSAKPPKLPVGPYILLERQEGENFFNAYNFFEGPDSAGSHGYHSYVNRGEAIERGMAHVTHETSVKDIFSARHSRKDRRKESFVFMGSAPTLGGPRDSIRLESIQRYDRGLFILDVRHMPVGCGVWPAFWLTDQLNWPKNGEIDIVEAVNYQSKAKTALHTVEGCTMEDAPRGRMTGDWDFAQGVPNTYTGLPDMTKRPARDCFAFAKDQWLNQGCAVTATEGGTIGAPLNAKGGGVYALEWDPVNQHIRTWVFTPHVRVPKNLVKALRTAHLPPKDRIAPNPEEWPLPYGYFPIGSGTNCEASPFQHMQIVFNTAFCGSAAGDRFSVDCPEQAKVYDTCEEWIKSQPEELFEAYWKIRGVYIYERLWKSS